MQVLDESTAFLEGELRRRGIINTDNLSENKEGAPNHRLKEDCLRDTSDLEPLPATSPASYSSTRNSVSGEWRMRPSVMD